MKKCSSTWSNLRLSVLGICSCLLLSCTSNDNSDPSSPTLPDNTLAYGDARSKIESVVYTVNDTGKIYTFYLSPTQGLVDLDAMLLADDYMKIATPTPTGTIDLLAANNQLLYKKVNISASAAEQVNRAALSLQLTSLTTAKLNLDVAMKDGTTLQAAYNGLCIKSGGQEQQNYDVTLTSRVFGYYMGAGRGTEKTNEYYIALTNAEWTGSGASLNLTTAGYMLVLDFYGAPGDSWKELPTGTFTESAKFGNKTYYADNSGVVYKADADAQMQKLQLVGPVQIERDDAGVVTVTATFLNKKYEEQTLIYKGDLKITNATLNVRLPMVDRDMVVDGAHASGIYEGDVYDNGSGLIEIDIVDKKGENNEPNGSSLHITLFSTKFLNPAKERHLTPGTYKAAKTLLQGTWMPAVEMELMGMVFPMGTYVTYADGTQMGQYSYAASGDIIIRESGLNKYTIEYDLKTIDDYTIRGSYTGEVYLENQAKDEKNDGSTTLESDYAMNMEYLNRMECYPQTEIYVPGSNFIPVSEIPNITPPGKACGCQLLMIGSTAGTWEVTEEYPIGGGFNGKGKGKLKPGDIFSMELLVQVGDEEKITPGTYNVTPNRYPAQFRPGVCVRGYAGSNGTKATAWQHCTSAIGWGYPDGYYDPNYKVENGWLNVPTIDAFASIYAGTITITKAAGGDNWFTFKIDGQDVLKHSVTGTWTGPVYLRGTDTPVLQSAVSTQTVAKRKAPLCREVKSAVNESLSRVPYRLFYQ